MTIFTWGVIVAVLVISAAIFMLTQYCGRSDLTKQTAHYEQHRRVIEARQELISFMEARLKRQAVPATLLRAASAPTLSPDTLLRSTYANPEPPEQLIRASASEDISKFG